MSGASKPNNGNDRVTRLERLLQGDTEPLTDEERADLDTLIRFAEHHPIAARQLRPSR